jgi:hypothetical protein
LGLGIGHSAFRIGFSLPVRYQKGLDGEHFFMVPRFIQRLIRAALKFVPRVGGAGINMLFSPLVFV